MSTGNRKKILTALADKFKALDGTQYTSNIFNNAYPKLEFWDSVSDFPAIYSSAGTEVREYLPGGFKWIFLNVSLKVYCKGETAEEELEQLLADIESVIDANRSLAFSTSPHRETTEIQITSINTDEGLLRPYAVGEVNLRVQIASQ